MTTLSRRIATLAVRVMCHNEEGTIAEAVGRVLEALGNRDIHVEVIDDGSTDASATRVRQVFGSDARVSLTAHSTNLGIGAVLRHAFRPTGADAVILVCSDLQFAPEDLPRLLEELEEHDLVIAQRARRDDPPLRKMLTAGEHLLTRLLVGHSFPDVHWVRAVRGRFLAPCRFETTSPMIDLELALFVADQGGRVGYVDLPHYRRAQGRGSGADPTRLAKSLLDLLWIAAKRRLRPR